MPKRFKEDLSINLANDNQKSILMEAMMVTITGIAAAMKNTG